MRNGEREKGKVYAKFPSFLISEVEKKHHRMSYRAVSQNSNEVYAFRTLDSRQHKSAPLSLRVKLMVKLLIIINCNTVNNAAPKK
jgi:hypothetical protein